jgi:hypothetical protein
MRRMLLRVFVTITLVLGLWAPIAHAGEPKEKPVIEQILDLLLQRGQISQEEYQTLQEKARRQRDAGVKEPGAGVLAGIDRGKPFPQSPDGDFRLEIGGLLQPISMPRSPIPEPSPGLSWAANSWSGAPVWRWTKVSINGSTSGSKGSLLRGSV